MGFVDDATFVLLGQRNKRRQRYSIAKEVVGEPDFSYLDESTKPMSPPMQSPIQSDSVNKIKDIIDEKMFVLGKKLDFLTSEIKSKKDIETKSKEPNKVIAEFKGKIEEILNTLNVLEMPQTDRALGEMILMYKDAKRDGLFARERELGAEVIDRLDGMVSVYLHLVRTLSELNRYLMDLYREGIIKEFDEEEAPPSRTPLSTPPKLTPVQPQTQLGPRPPPPSLEENSDESVEFADEEFEE